MSNKRVTAYHIAVPLDFKAAINSSIGDVSGTKAARQALELYFCQKTESEADSMSCGIVMLVHTRIVSSPLILTQKG